MTVADLIEKLTKCDPLATVVTEDGESGYDVEFEVYEIDAAVSRRVDGTLCSASHPSRHTPPDRIQRVVCVTSWGHSDDNAKRVWREEQ
jgi:hypothetical protein